MAAKKKSDWIDHLLETIKNHIELRKYRFSRHAVERQKQRSLELLDVIHVLTNGFHEENKTSFNTNFQVWNYAIGGKCLDGADARVIIAFHDDMLIITAIRLTKGVK